MSNRQTIKTTLWVLCLLALGLRIGAVFSLHSWRHPDAMEHRTIAYSIVHGQGFSFKESFASFEPSSIQSPPYPLLLAGCFKVFGEETPAAYTAAMMINCLAGAAAVALTFLLARSIGAGQAVAMLAAALVAVWPTQIYACTVAQAVVLITAAITAVMGLFYISIRTGRLRPWLAFSITGTLAALTEPAFLPAMILAGIAILFCGNLGFGARLRNAVVLLFSAVLIIGPWTLRNHAVHHAWVPVKSTFWVNTWKGNNDLATGSDRIEMTSDEKKRMGGLDPLDDSEIRVFDQGHQYKGLTPEQRDKLGGMAEQQREAVFKQITVDWIKAHPSRYLQLCGIRLCKTLWIDWDNPKSYNRIYLWSRASLLATGAIGLLLALRRRWSLGFPALIFLSTLALYTLTITAARFSIPFEPLMLSFSALALISAWRWISGQRDPADERTTGARA